MDSDESLVDIKKERIWEIIQSKKLIIVLVILLVILGVYIRSIPMQDHNGKPGLWDITTNTWTLGPDLDPWLFLRGAKTIVATGGLPEIDLMRNVPLGFNNAIESQLLPYLIAYTYYVLKIFSDVNVEFAGVVFPVIFFALTILSFFFFVREIFIEGDVQQKTRANFIAIISSLFMIVIPTFLSRTVAGIPEKESAGFFFMFLAFYLFLKAWKSKNKVGSLVFGTLAGLATGAMGLIWGGVVYVFIVIGLAVLVAFVLGHVTTTRFVAYGSWIVVSFALLMYFSQKYGILEMFTSLSSGLSFLTLVILIVHSIAVRSRLSSINFVRKYKIPFELVSIVFSVVILILLGLIFFGPDFIVEKIKAFHQAMFRPVSGRWNTTVAENKQPYFIEWVAEFGPHVRNIPLFFWTFFIGSVLLFYKTIEHLKRKDAFVLTGSYVILLFGIMFSRYSGSVVLNGDNIISKSFYYLSVLLFAFCFLRYYYRYSNHHKEALQKIKFEYILLFSLLIFTLFSVRGAVRLIMVLGPVAAIFVGFLLVFIIDKSISEKNRGIFWKIVAVIVLLMSIYIFFTYYQSVTAQAYVFVPNAYTVQWQKSMDWVRDNTPSDAVFSHWWDYGYWVQSIGERATSVDGGNAITYWNYLIGRFVLTGDNEADALEFLYNHNTTHFLIDSSDVGKYTAFSIIGSNENYDRYSWFGAFLLDQSQTQETKDEIQLIYPGGIALDEDLVIQQNGSKIFLPANSAGVGALVTPMTSENSFKQPYVIIVYQNKRYDVPLRYLYTDGQMLDFKSGIDAAAFIYPRITTQGNSVGLTPNGAAFFISPRLLRGMFSQVYLMDDPFNRFPHFKLVHTEPALVIDDLRSQGMELPDFVYFNGLQGPIKIWEISYTGKEQIREEYIDTDASKYLSWKL